MKLLLAVAVAVATALAEPPVDNRYLPPQNGFSGGGTGSGLTPPSQTYGPPQFGPQRQTDALIRPSTAYGTPNSRPSMEYGTPNQFGSQSGSNRPSSQYGAPGFGNSRPSTQSGTPGFGSSRPSTEYGTPGFGNSRPSTEYGTPGFGNSKPSTQFGTPGFGNSRPSTEYGAPGFGNSRPSTQFGTPGFGNSRPSTEYGTPGFGSPRPSAQYGAPGFGNDRPSAQYSAPNSGFGSSQTSNQLSSSIPSNQYGAPGVGSPNTGLNRPSSEYGAPQFGSNAGAGSFNQPERQYLPPNSNRNGYSGEDQGNNEPANYSFEYMVKDEPSGNDFGHRESRQGERAEGIYYVLLPDGRKQTVEYEADEGGYRPKITYEDTGVGAFGGNGINFQGSGNQGYQNNQNYPNAGGPY